MVRVRLRGCGVSGVDWFSRVVLGERRRGEVTIVEVIFHDTRSGPTE